MQLDDKTRQKISDSIQNNFLSMPCRTDSADDMFWHFVIFISRFPDEFDDVDSSSTYMQERKQLEHDLRESISTIRDHKKHGVSTKEYFAKMANECTELKELVSEHWNSNLITAAE